MRIEHEGSAENGRFTTADGGSELTYRRTGEGVVSFDHTFVPPEQRGKGIAEALVRAGAEWARTGGVKIQPTCPYVATLFRRKRPEFADVAAD